MGSPLKYPCYCFSRIIRFQEKEETELKEWRKQAGVFLDWMDKMDVQFDVIEEMKCEDDISELTKQAQALKVTSN